MINDDLDLVRQYADSKSEEAFATVVSRHVNLVYSVALRMVRDPQLAEEITQTVFVILARKAGSLSSKTIVSGWLCQTARYASARALTIQRRRQLREHEAFMHSQSNAEESDASAWVQIEPLLDQAMEQLGEKDHAAVVLRFFEGRPFAEVSAALGTSEAGAKMRVNRALEKLRKFFGKRKIALSAAVIAGAVSANSVQAAPLTLAQSATSLAIAHGAAASSSTLTLLKGTLKLMAWTKAKTAVIAGIVVLVTAGAAPVAYREYQDRRWYSWEVPKADWELVHKTPPQVKIVPTKFEKHWPVWAAGNNLAWGSEGMMEINGSVESIARHAYRCDRVRTVVVGTMPSGLYDAFCKLASKPGSYYDWTAVLQEELKRKFGVSGHREKRVTDVLVLQRANTETNGFKVSNQRPGYAVRDIAQRERSQIIRGYEFHRAPVSIMIDYLERGLGLPVLDRSDLADRYDYSLTWVEKPPSRGIHLPFPSNLENLNQSLISQLGLELVPGREPIEMLILEKAK